MRRCGRVAFTLPHVPVRLKGPKPELFQDEGDTLAARLRKRRRQLGVRQVDVANMMGVNESSVVNWETGKEEPRGSLLAENHRLPGVRTLASCSDAYRETDR